MFFIDIGSKLRSKLPKEYIIEMFNSMILKKHYVL